MRANNSQMFGFAMTVLFVLFVLAFPIKGESVLTRVVRSTKVLQ